MGLCPVLSIGLVTEDDHLPMKQVFFPLNVVFILRNYTLLTIQLDVFCHRNNQNGIKDIRLTYGLQVQVLDSDFCFPSPGLLSKHDPKFQFSLQFCL